MEPERTVAGERQRGRRTARRRLGATRGSGARPALAIALVILGCGPRDSGPYDEVVTLPPGGAGTVASGGGSADGSFPPGETDPGCGCDAQDDGSDGSDPGSDGSDAGSGGGGLGDGSGDGAGDGAGDLVLPPAQGRRSTSRAVAFQLEATLTGAGCLHGILADEEGRRMAGAMVSAAGAGGAGAATAVTTARGHFCIHAARAREQRCVELGTVVPSGR